MKVLVTGGAGYIGSVCVERLLDAGHQVAVFDNLETGHRSAVDARATFVLGDLRDAEAVARALRREQPEAVMHFAAYASVGESMRCPERYFRNNVVGTANLLDAALETGARRIVFSSTCATYGEPAAMPMSEATPQSPTNPYGESKLMVEKMLRWHHRAHGLGYVCLRYFNAAGASARFGEDHDPESHLIPLALQVAAGLRKELQIFGTDYDTPDGTCVRDYIHILDLADAHLAALAGGQSGEFNLGNGDGYSVREVIDAARRVTGRPIAVVEAARRPGDPPRLIADASLARRQLGWTPAHAELDAIVESAWTWRRAHPEGYGD